MAQMIRRGFLLLAVLALLAMTSWLALQRARAAVPDSAGLAEQAAAPTPGSVYQPDRRERDEAPQEPAISFIDSPTAACRRSNLLRDECYINWYTLYVHAYPAYVISMTINIDSRMRGSYQGFFQTNFNFVGDLNGLGFRVPCGTPGASGIPGLGMAHSYTIRARASDGLGAANYGSVVCPAGPQRTYLPMTRR